MAEADDAAIDAREYMAEEEGEMVLGIMPADGCGALAAGSSSTVGTNITQVEHDKGASQTRPPELAVSAEFGGVKLSKRSIRYSTSFWTPPAAHLSSDGPRLQTLPSYGRTCNVILGEEGPGSPAEATLAPARLLRGGLAPVAAGSEQRRRHFGSACRRRTEHGAASSCIVGVT
jgi:hypothetical protein